MKAHSLETTASHPVLATERDAVLTLLSSLQDALGILEPRCGRDQTLLEAKRIADRASDRLRLSATHTVVALMGEAGVGKSALYNAIAGLDLARVSEVSPTTMSPHACIWGPKGAADLIEWLGIEPSRQVSRESPLDAEKEAGLRGLILVDMPDSDAWGDKERQSAQRVMERADMLVWVTGIKKPALPVNGRDDLIVLLNKVDCVDADEAQQQLKETQKLLTERGISDAYVLATSAVRGDGIPAVRSMLLAAVATRVIAMQRLASDLSTAGRSLKIFSGRTLSLKNVESTTQSDSYPANEDLASLCEAVESEVNVDAVSSDWSERYQHEGVSRTEWPLVRWARQIWHFLRKEPKEEAEENALSVQERDSIQERDARKVASTVDTWIGTIVKDLPTPWDQTLARALSAEKDVDHPRGDLWPAIQQVVHDFYGRRHSAPKWWQLVSIAQWFSFVVLSLGAAWLLVWSLWETVGDVTIPFPVLANIPVPAGLMLGAGAAGLGIHFVAGWRIRQETSIIRREVRDSLTKKLHQAVDVHIVSPLRHEIAAYETVCRAIARMDTAH